MSAVLEGSLLTRTRQLLKDTEQSYLKIYSDTGLNPNWLSQLSVGAIPNPSVNKIQQLYEYLAGKRLPVGE